MKKNYYDQAYFTTRDLLSLHLAESIKLFMQEHNLERVLDVGCGTGRLVHYLRQHRFSAYGCDNEKVAVLWARKMNSPQIIKKASATDLPYNKCTFDLVTSIHMIEHLSARDIAKFLSESRRILKPLGFVFLVAPNFGSPLRYLQGKNWFGYEDPTHIRFDTPQSISNLLKTHGFTQI